MVLKNPKLKKGLVDKDGNNALYYATMYNNLEIVKFLIQENLSNKGNDNGFTCLHLAAKLGYYKIVKYFLSSMHIN